MFAANGYHVSAHNSHLVQRTDRVDRTLSLSFGQEFVDTESRRLVVFWTLVSVSIVGSFLVVLLCIWKMDAFRDYRRSVYWRSSDDGKRICKPLQNGAAAFPARHQIVPTLFPSDSSAAGDPSSTLPFGRLATTIFSDLPH